MGRKKKIVKYIFPAIGLLVVLLTVLKRQTAFIT